MRRIVIDTNIYIDWFNEGSYDTVLFEAGAVKYLSSIVLMELLAGAFRAGDRKLIRSMIRAFAIANRILLPSARNYEDAGEVLRALQASRGYVFSRSHSLVNDVLIALSARQIGATVITQNERDFRAIQEIRKFKLVRVH